jgi:hypothetical protein
LIDNRRKIKSEWNSDGVVGVGVCIHAKDIMTAVTGWTTTERGGVRLEQHNITYLRSHDERLLEKGEGRRKGDVGKCGRKRERRLGR